MKKIATIDNIVNDRIYATYKKNSEGSHSKTFFKTKEDLYFEINNTKNLEISQGDSVEILIEPKNAITVSFSVFILPLILFFVVFNISKSISPNNSDFFHITFGFIGIVIAFFTTFIFFKKYPQKLPVITKKLTQEEIAKNACSSCGSCKSCG